METSLHRQLKGLYAGPRARFEAPVGAYRVDVVDRGRLIEIQHGALAAIRDKVRDLTEKHRVVVVKPIICTKVLVKLDGEGGREVSRRLSPKRGRLLDLFEELVHFTRAFPHERLTLEVPLVDIEERRYPGHGRRRRWRENDFQVEDQQLVKVHETVRLRTVDDLVSLVLSHCAANGNTVGGESLRRESAKRELDSASNNPHPRPLSRLLSLVGLQGRPARERGARAATSIPSPFHTGDLAAALGEPRSIAQRIAYCLLHAGGLDQVGKQGNARLYRWRKAA